jgi:cytochrome oxidase Cu insertion factor (SCO1/SenC/PrrC family)
VISVDPTDTPASVRHAAHEWGWRGHDWSWLMGSHAQLQPVWDAYGIGVITKAGDIEHVIATFLVDSSGHERAAFLPPIRVHDLVRDVALLRSSGDA